jgi:hypothetical protein
MKEDDYFEDYGEDTTTVEKVSKKRGKSDKLTSELEDLALGVSANKVSLHDTLIHTSACAAYRCTTMTRAVASRLRGIKRVP